MTAAEQYLAPQTLEEAVRVAGETNATILAGGTDLLPRWSRGLVQRSAPIVSLRRVESLRGVSHSNGDVLIGACTPLSEIANDPIIRTSAPILAEAAGRVACPQIRNRATIGGNLCNASPAADTAIPLILLDAVIELASWKSGGTSATGGGRYALREVPITDFFRGPGSTAVAPGEILTRIRFRPLANGVFAKWDKFGTRPAMEIAVASVGVALKIESGAVTHARVGFGSVAPVPLRGRNAEAQLVRNPLSEEIIEKCVAAALEEIAPITDLRASEAYRRQVTAVMLRRMLEDARHA